MSSASLFSGLWKLGRSSFLHRMGTLGKGCSPWNHHPLHNTLIRSFATKKHKRVIKMSKGFRGRSKNTFKAAIRRLEKSLHYAYVGRKLKRRRWKRFWIQRIQAGVRQYFFSYSEFMHLLKKESTKIHLNRRMLAEIAANEPFAFKSIVDVVQCQTGTMKVPRYEYDDEEYLCSPESDEDKEDGEYQ